MRVFFKKGKQKEFISKCCGENNLKEFIDSKKIDVPYYTLKKYYQEKLTLPLDLFTKLCGIYAINKNSLNFELIPDNWGAIKGGKKGIKTLNKKYSHKLKQWRAKGGRKSILAIVHTKKIKIPFLDEKFAEFIGAYLGDGTLTRYFIRMSGDKRYDLPYFKYLSKIIEDSSGIKSSISSTKTRNLLYLEVRSKVLCDHLNKKYSLKFGSKIKNRTKIPGNILKNKRLFFACLRGLMDTDGSVSKDNNVLSVRFSNNNSNLLNQIKKINQKYKLFNFRGKEEIGIKSLKGVKNYFKVVGSSNLRHIVRFEEFLKGNLIKKRNVLKYYNDYKDIGLPYHEPVVQWLAS